MNMQDYFSRLEKIKATIINYYHKKYENLLQMFKNNLFCTGCLSNLNNIKYLIKIIIIIINPTITSNRNNSKICQTNKLLKRSSFDYLLSIMICNKIENC